MRSVGHDFCYWSSPTFNTTSLMVCSNDIGFHLVKSDLLDCHSGELSSLWRLIAALFLQRDKNDPNSVIVSAVSWVLRLSIEKGAAIV
jgi:hypothetical protein